MMLAGLQIVLTLQRYFLSSAPQGLIVESRSECISKCYFNTTCHSVFYQASSKTCYLSDAVYTQDDLDGSADMQYLEWKRDGCDSGYSWNRTLDLCYKAYTGSTKSWGNAENFCIQNGAHLLKVGNLETTLLMNHIAVNHGRSLWLGGTDIQEEGTWVWTDNSTFQTEWWDTDTDRPHTGKNSNDCLVVYPWSGEPVNKWRDHSCTKQHGYVCQLPVAPSCC
ncbi:C-type lectin mannose-binding isoform-like [Haliotis cracherodii]|uniref:C-type lectin mannose-binding isoform-like n=1 Tax=Haliotis cracherodii TaxID=6455 RepID=UPI0039EC0555